MFSVNNIYRRLESYLSTHTVWNNTYGFARSTIAFGSLITLIFNHSSILFRPHIGLLEVPSCSDINSFSLYCLFSNNLELARFISIGCLVLVVIGWRPRVTGILHWYVTFSLSATATVLDGGDHIATILTFLLLPICLTDKRIWHWSQSQTEPNNLIFLISGTVAVSASMIIRLQMCLVYLHAASAKLSVAEWQDGTATYYWFTHPTFGISNSLLPFFLPLLQNGVIITTITWGTIILELLLFTGILATRGARKKMFYLGIAFHFSIILVHGLFSFFFSMLGGLILYLLPLNEQISYSKNKTIN
jgi:antimicrobial peptide system SdpB family protein